MYIPCPACNKRLQIPDNKLPTDHPVRITCPACQQRFSYDPRAHRSLVAPLQTRVAPQLGMVSRPQRMMADPNAMQALICLDSPEHQDRLSADSPNPRLHGRYHAESVQGLGVFTRGAYRLFVLDAAFDGTSLDTNLVLTFLRERPLDQRRYQFVVLCAPDTGERRSHDCLQSKCESGDQPR